MSTTNDETSAFTAPGPGCWEFDPVHMPRPVTAWLAETAPKPSTEGFSITAARYGLLVDGMHFAVVDGFWYNRLTPFGLPVEGFTPADVPRRLENARIALETKSWRAHLAHWDTHVKPRARALQSDLRATDVRGADDAELRIHLADCRDALGQSWRRHHEYTVTCLLPMGDYLAHSREWTGLPFGELLQPLRGSSPVSRGFAANELHELGDALALDAPLLRRLEALAPEDAVEAMRAAHGAVGQHARAWLDLVGHRSLGYDVTDPYALEMPQVLVQAALAEARHDEAAEDEAARAAEARVRELVPAEHLALWSELLDEARTLNRLRDERGTWSDSWAAGLSRRAMLEVGRRLCERGVLPDPELALDASHDELQSFLSCAGGPSVAELERRRHRRTSRAVSDAPAWLGEPPSPPPPTDGLPPHAARLMRAIGTAIEALFAEPPAKESSTDSFDGLPVSAGVYEGPARIVLDASGFGRLRQGDVLVTRSTSATFTVVLPLLGAIVTDRGGQLCHAAIVARESGIPGVVGTTVATTRLRDGQRIRVDGARGVVTVLP